MYQQQPYLYQQPIYHPQSIQEHEQFQEQYLEQEPEEQYAEISEEERYLETIYQANKALNKTNWTIIDDETQPTKEGYQTAWNELEKKLESGELSEPKVYQYETTNPYLLEGEEVDIDSLIAEATELYEKGLVSEAILKFEAIVQHEKGKENAEVWRLLGVCHTENDNDHNAITALERSMDLDPYNLNTLLSLGTCYVNELDSVKALETLRTWVANNPKFVGLEVPQDEYSDGTLMDEVIQLMLAVAKHSPDDLDVQILLGVLFNISLDYGQAIECFDRVLDTMHTDYSVLNKVFSFPVVSLVL
jgi:peroxin-5